MNYNQFMKAVEEKLSNITANQLKLIAIVAMLIDHIATKIIWELYLDAAVVNGVHMMGGNLPPRAKQLHFIYTIMRIIGRLTFPIFAFTLVEGFLHTSNLKQIAII
ncbi:TraX family protein [Jeotgalibaca porci]|uniref:TraX family protein n=1 Tax=Jeotgalibaca porci TaxID=1868793 RepID=UPI0035A12E13